VKEQPRRLLAEAGITVTETAGAERCCGFGGTFCVKMPAVSVAMADDKLDEWSEAGVTTVVGGDLSCLAHLEGRARRRALPMDFRHLAEVLRP
jgi:L-lactate dehydrogenase complex protein LldE